VINLNPAMPTPYEPEQLGPNALFGIGEHIPGITTGIAFQAGRSSRTIMAGGGFMDDVTGRRAGRAAQKYGGFRKGAMTLAEGDMNTGKQFMNFGRLNRRSKMAAKAGANPIGYGARVNTLTARPRALGRISSLSALTNEGGTYTYAQGLRSIGKQRFGPLGKLAETVGAAKGENILGPGLFGSIITGGKANNLERQALKGNAKALAKLKKLDVGIERLARTNTPQGFANAARFPVGTSAARIGADTGYMVGMGISTPAERLAVGRALHSEIRGAQTIMGLSGTVSEVGTRGNLLASSMAGAGTRYMAGYVRGATGFAGIAGLSGAAEQGAKKAVTQFAGLLGEEGFLGRSGAKYVGEKGAQTLLQGSLFKEMGIKGIGEALMTKSGAKVLGARGLAMALPGINLLATASIIYDIGKMGGVAIKSGINLARDAEKSLQGSFNKPMFGMGYRDTEAAATSRSRGVMAIQNSRLNARSALGNEAGMMAAHFG